MKYSAIQEKTAQEIRMSHVRNFNEKELNSFMSRLGISQISEKLRERILWVDRRFSKIRLLTYEEFDDKFPHETVPDAIDVKIGEVDSKTGFPVLYLYAAELSGIAQRTWDKNQKLGNFKRISSCLAGGKYNLKVDENPEVGKKLKELILNVLPASLPYDLSFDGSSVRIQKLAEKNGSVMYTGSGEIFAVIHNYRNQPMLTIFLPELDYVKSFADDLVKKLGISQELANEISYSIPHDMYYSVMGLHEDFEEYVTKMAFLLKAEKGEIIHDILQGDVEIVRGAHSGRLAVDLDDEMASAILIGNKLNVFVPN